MRNEMHGTSSCIFLMGTGGAAYIGKVMPGTKHVHLPKIGKVVGLHPNSPNKSFVKKAADVNYHTKMRFMVSEDSSLVAISQVIGFFTSRFGFWKTVVY